MEFSTKHIDVTPDQIRLFNLILFIGIKRVESSSPSDFELEDEKMYRNSIHILLEDRLEDINARELMEKPIKQDKEAGKTDAIDHLLLPHTLALVAIYQKIIDEEHLLRSENREDGTIFIPKVMLCDMPINCIIIPEDHEYTNRLQGSIVATIDSQGNIV